MHRRMRAFTYAWSLLTKMAVTQFDLPNPKTLFYTKTAWFCVL